MLLNLPGCAPGPNKVGFLHLRLIIALLRKHKENTVSLLLSKIKTRRQKMNIRSLIIQAFSP